MTKTKAPRVSLRGAKTPPSPIRKLVPFANAAKERGTKVYHLNIGQPDIRSPLEFIEGVRKFNDPIIAYEASRGNEALCKAWSDYMNRSLNLKTNPDHFLITSGASEALLYAFVGCCDPGDEILFFDPTYANYIGFAATVGVVPKTVTTTLETNFALPSREVIERAISPRTKAIMFCSPNNPTGTVYSRKDIELLLSICRERGMMLIADETYREFTYDGLEFLSVYHVSPGDPHAIIIDSLSKRFSLCGARIGCLVTSNEDFYNASYRLATARLASPTIEQYAAVHMFQKLSDDFMAPVRVEYQKRRDTLLSALSKIPDVTVQKPHGAFYCMAGLPVKNAEAFATFMLKDFSYKNATTFVAPGKGFYLDPQRGDNEIRLAYVLNASDIMAAIECLGQGLAAYRTKE